MWPSTETLELFASRQFATALLAGAMALGFALVAQHIWPRAQGNRFYGLLVAVATIAMLGVGEFPRRLIAGLIILAASGMAHGQARRIPILATLAGVPGAYVVAYVAPLPNLSGYDWVIFALIAVGAPCIAGFEERNSASRIGPVLFTTTIATAFFVVPDTEQILVMLGVAIPLTLLTWSGSRASIGAAGAFVVLGLYGWIIAAGGAARPSSLVGAFGALGFFLVEPVARYLDRDAPHLGHLPTRRFQVIGLVAHGLIVTFGGRLAGVQETVAAAAAILCATWVLAWVLAMLGTKWARRRQVQKTAGYGPE